MKKEQVVRCVRIILAGALYLVGIGVLFQAVLRQSHSSRFLVAQIGGALFVALIPVAMLLYKKNKMNLIKVIWIFACINVAYFLFTIKDFVESNVGNHELINTQSFWYSSTNQLNRDVLIYTIMRDKTAVIPAEDVWYVRFVEMFSNDLEVDSSLDRLLSDADKDDLYNAGIMRMRTLEDLFDDETYSILDKRLANEEYQYLYVETDRIKDFDKIAVLSDEDYNIYLIAYE